MEHALSILMFGFAGLLLLYSLLLFATGDPLLIPKHHAAKMRDEKEYARQLGKACFLLAIAPAAAGLAGLFLGNIALFIVLIAGFVLCIWGATRVMKDQIVIEPDEEEEDL